MIFWCRRWIEHSRSPKVTMLPCWSATIWHLDVAGLLDVALAEDRAVAEGAERLAPGRGDRLAQRLGVAHDPHARGRRRRTAALTSTGNSSTSDGSVQRRQHRHVGLGEQRLRVDLRGHHRDDLGGRADPGQPGVGDRRGEVGVLGQEAVAGMDRVGAGLAGRRDDQVAAQVGRRSARSRAAARRSRPRRRTGSRCRRSE